MKRRTFFPFLAAIAAIPFIGFPKTKARPITRRKVWKGQRKVWLGSGHFNDPNNWEPYGVPQRPDTIIVQGSELTIPPGRRFKRLEVHEGIVTLDNDSCDNYCCFDELIVVKGDNVKLMAGEAYYAVGEHCAAIHIGS